MIVSVLNSILLASAFACIYSMYKKSRRNEINIEQNRTTMINKLKSIDDNRASIEDQIDAIETKFDTIEEDISSVEFETKLMKRRINTIENTIKPKYEANEEAKYDVPLMITYIRNKEQSECSFEGFNGMTDKITDIIDDKFVVEDYALGNLSNKFIDLCNSIQTATNKSINSISIIYKSNVSNNRELTLYFNMLNKRPYKFRCLKRHGMHTPDMYGLVSRSNMVYIFHLDLASRSGRFNICSLE